MRKRLLAIISGAVLLSLQSGAQPVLEHDDSRHIDLTVHFLVNRNFLDTTYVDNSIGIREFLTELETLKRDSLATFTRAEVVGSASPEGYQERNYVLSTTRAEALKSFLEPVLELPESAWSLSGVGSNWEELKTLSASLDRKYSDEIVNIVDNVPIWVKEKGRIVGGRKQSLMDLERGDVWHILEWKVFPELRKATVTLHYYTSPAPVPVPVAVSVPIPSPEPDSSVVEPRQRKVILALKSNLLYDVCLSPSIGLEVPVGKRFSVAGEWTYTWWNNDDRPLCYRHYGGDLAFRWWFARKEADEVLTGHHLGVYGQMFTFDYMFKESAGVQSSRWNYAAGLEYGYSLPLGERLNLDFALGVGHIWGQYDRYWQLREGDGYRYIRQDTRSCPAVLPTKAEISLVWLIK